MKPLALIGGRDILVEDSNKNVNFEIKHHDIRTQFP